MYNYGNETIVKTNNCVIANKAKDYGQPMSSFFSKQLTISTHTHTLNSEAILYKKKSSEMRRSVIE